MWGEYLAQRSQLVTRIANRIRRSPSQDATQPVWAPPGSHPHLAIMGKVAVCIHLGTHDQPEQHSCPPLRRSGNTTSTEASPDAATTTAVMKSERARPLDPHEIAGQKIDSACPNHPRSTRTPHPAPAHRSAPRQAECVEAPET
jgi:hypothetical protein